MPKRGRGHSAFQLELVGGTWLTHEEVVERRKQQAEAQAALEKWLPVLGRLQPQIDGDNFQLRDKAAAELQDIDQPAVIIAFDAMLAVAGPQFQEEAVKRSWQNSVNSKRRSPWPVTPLFRHTRLCDAQRPPH